MTRDLAQGSKHAGPEILTEPDRPEVSEATRFSRTVRSLVFALEFLLSAKLGPAAWSSRGYRLLATLQKGGIQSCCGGL